jgi:addiction module HigA family antidote
MKKIPFAYSIHPGEILKTEFMEPLGLSSYRLAKDLHVSAPRVNDIVLASGRSRPTPQCASVPTKVKPRAQAA